ncbi:gag protease polyprotein [Cucumis melo var. makuwa]|uniref:Gag protease polyprotein n=1 Tax=Cucumis melo var. makuwa TaxID=1194695 RepID=A0A5A7SNR5_CUCMM|nr:gag protease polyprotein [Cucumis melo var. makuwa]TYJ98753.1 gag protease polyprotein [Cucumis melo var. makuwa]
MPKCHTVAQRHKNERINLDNFQDMKIKRFGGIRAYDHRSSGDFCRFQQKPFEVEEAVRGKPLCTTCGKHHLGRCLFGTRTCFKCKQERHTTNRCPMRLIGVAQNQGVGAPQ